MRAEVKKMEREGVECSFGGGGADETVEKLKDSFQQRSQKSWENNRRSKERERPLRSLWSCVFMGFGMQTHSSGGNPSDFLGGLGYKRRRILSLGFDLIPPVLLLSWEQLAGQVFDNHWVNLSWGLHSSLKHHTMDLSSSLPVNRDVL